MASSLRSNDTRFVPYVWVIWTRMQNPEMYCNQYQLLGWDSDLNQPKGIAWKQHVYYGRNVFSYSKRIDLLSFVGKIRFQFKGFVEKWHKNYWN